MRNCTGMGGGGLRSWETCCFSFIDIPLRLTTLAGLTPILPSSNHARGHGLFGPNHSPPALVGSQRRARREGIVSDALLSRSLPAPWRGGHEWRDHLHDYGLPVIGSCNYRAVITRFGI